MQDVLQYRPQKNKCDKKVDKQNICNGKRKTTFVLDLGDIVSNEL